MAATDVSLCYIKQVAYLTTDAIDIGMFYKNGVEVSSPALAVGDVKISKDKGAFNNITNLPSAIGGSTYSYSQQFTGGVGGESDCYVATVQYRDQTSPTAWDAFEVVVRFGTNRNDQLATAATALSNLVWTNAKAAFVDALISTRSTVTDDTVADAVWDELLAAHAIAGSAGKMLADLSLAGIAASVWSYSSRTLTMSIGAILSAIRGDEIEVDAGDDFELTVTNLGDISGRTKLWMTFKDSKADADTAAHFKMEETAGLEIIAGATADTPANGSITVNDETTGNVTFRLVAEETVKLIEDEGKGYVDIKWTNAAGRNITLRRVRGLIVSDVTREVG